jgi:hypothetical protein
MNDHPMYANHDRPRIATRPIEQLAEAILLATEDDFEALQVSGRSGDGKSTAALYLSRHHLTWLKRDAPMGWVFVPRRTNASDAALYKILQKGLKSPSATTAAALDRMGNIVDRICSSCQLTRAKCFYLFLDEAQRLSANDYDYLANIADQVKGSGFHLFSIFMNQSDDIGPTRLKSKIHAPDNTPHTVKRFFMAKHVFKGLAGLEEIAHALSRYDHLEHEGVPFPAFFAPAAYERGWRLASDADKVVSAIDILRAEAGLTASSDLSMFTFERMVRRLLVRVIGGNPGFAGFTVQDVTDAISKTGYLTLETVRKEQVVT